MNRDRVLAQAKNIREGEQRVYEDGTVITVNPCSDPTYQGCVYVTVKESNGMKVTWIVRDGYIVAEK